MTMVSKQSPLPFYYQVYQHLRTNIENGIYAKEQKLPPERILSEEFGVNRFTIRSAVKRLISEGFVYPIRRKGYFVNLSSINIELNKNTSYTKSILEKNMIPHAKILEIQTVCPSKEQIELFKLNDSDMVWMIYFLRYYNGVPTTLTRSFIPLDRAPDLNIHLNKTKSLYKTLDVNYGIKPVRISSICEASMAEKNECRLLSLNTNSPLLFVTSIAVDQAGTPVEQCFSKFRSDIVKLKVEMT